ncbi:unnamed protein product [Rangifer tarandus platyrhynchus]|uniref:Uncharacterized protein n=1 Tax=Rangifer tarandus platyrhynchus TaxID=3082113 RepID=A0ABN9A1U9_RANTA|nr:unnamed protein product [Rangifer tarandus platyrhynchus]
MIDQVTVPDRRSVFWGKTAFSGRADPPHAHDGASDPGDGRAGGDAASKLQCSMQHPFVLGDPTGPLTLTTDPRHGAGSQEEEAEWEGSPCPSHVGQSGQRGCGCASGPRRPLQPSCVRQAPAREGGPQGSPAHSRRP